MQGFCSFSWAFYCNCSSDEAQSQNALSTEQPVKHLSWVPFKGDELISSLNLKNVIRIFNNFQNAYVEMTEARYDKMLVELETGETKFKEFLPDALKGEYNHVQIPDYKDKCLFCLLCNSWAIKGDHSLLDAYVTKANIVACPIFTCFCVHIDFHPFSLPYDNGKTSGLDALTGDSQLSNEIVGAYHSMVIKPLLGFVNVASISSKTHSGEFE